jgi:hypothetical protein
LYDEILRGGIEDICAILDELKVPYHITGGLAASFYGEPRFTQDLDLVVRLEPNSLQASALLQRRSTRYLVDRVSAMDAFRRQSLFQALDQDRVLKIDLHVGEKIPGELDRSTRRELLPGLVAALVAKEDPILSKLLWIRQGSEKSKRDAIQMLKGADDVDWSYLCRQSVRLGLDAELTEIEEAASTLHPPDDATKTV